MTATGPARHDHRSFFGQPKGVLESRWTFRPTRVFFEESALDYDLGRRLWNRFALSAKAASDTDGEVAVRMIPSHNRVTGLPGATPAQAYLEAKRTLVVGVRRGLDFAPCRPSAHYQLPLVTGCPGRCEYCYLQTTLGRRPYVRVYVNLDEILGKAAELTAAGAETSPAEGVGTRSGDGRAPVYFEGAAVGDPVPVEPFTGALAATVRFFAGLERGRFRFVTKFPDVDGLLGLEHRGHTRVRVTCNPDPVIRAFDHGTPGLKVRLATLRRLATAGYPVGVMIAPVFLHGEWRRDYADLFGRLSAALGNVADLTLEIVTHRFTTSARRVILERYPESGLPMGEKGRRLKRGQFGYFKYVYPESLIGEAREFFFDLARRYLPRARFDYLV